MNVVGITVRVSPDEVERMDEMLPGILPDALEGILSIVFTAIKRNEPTGQKDGDLLFSAEATLVNLNSVQGQNIKDAIDGGLLPDFREGQE